ncbi:N-acetylneuraminate synthase family protein [Azospirillum soli]|uniref:N-acetylneuraminate synthase family protein n=1 Tax=Azospirillum soli TaxID=1304799 RepID=UPI001AE3CA45|nr:N-acetylneuraminate synthase family protein [Azospirillum soli]MBP2316247.1 sialic acid synthase SpsE [Azospirillum soli]
MKKTYVIAEMAWSHDGQVGLACDIVRGAAAAGANAISIHITHLPDYMVRHYRTGPGRVSAGHDQKPIYTYLEDINLSFDDWRQVAATAREVGIDLLVMPNDAASLAFARGLEPQAYVLSAAAFEEHGFIQEIARAGKPMYLRIGGATLGEIETVVGLVRGVVGDEAAITLLYGHQDYPTRVEDNNVRVVAALRDTFGLPVGLADHLDADDPFALVMPLLALPLGATCIEKHITHDRSRRGEDFESALSPDEFTRFVDLIRKAEQALGQGSLLGLAQRSVAYRQNSRKRLVAARDLRAGELIDETAVIAKRSDEGASPAHQSYFIGAHARTDIRCDEGLTFDLVTRSAQ